MAFIESFKSGDKVQGYYLCKYKQILKNKNGKDYCSIKLQDQTGIVDGKIWAMHPGIEEFAADDVVYVEGEVLLYQDNIQLNIGKVQQSKEGDYSLEHLIPHTSKDAKLLEEELFKFIESVESAPLKKLLESIFYDEQIYASFMKAGAAKSVHHAYLSGLLEHTVTVTQIGNFMSGLYENVNRDLVIAGCLLHDIGKLYELSPFPQNDYTDEGQLLGHIMIGVEKVHDAAREIADFPREMILILKHILLSHHGEYEYGSPKRPKCIEAMIVHLADHSDAKIKIVEEMIQGVGEGESYAGYNKILTRNIRKVNL